MGQEMKSLTQHMTEAFARDGVTLTDSAGKPWPILTLNAVLKAAAEYEKALKYERILEAMREAS
jgi:hypothetical protein